MKKFLGSLLVLFSFYWEGAILFAEPKTNPCMAGVIPLEKTRDTVASVGGIWGQFEKSKILSPHSADALQLDSTINRVLSTLKYLCATLNGVPLNELAEFVRSMVAEKGESRFRQEMIILGKPEAEIDIWLDYYKIALANQHRTLDDDGVKKSIRTAGKFFQRYRDLSEELKYKHTDNPVLQETVKLKKDLRNFVSTDPYVSLGIKEENQVPYWDVDENYGGS